jgi:hypothetical protein
VPAPRGAVKWYGTNPRRLMADPCFDQQFEKLFTRRGLPTGTTIDSVSVKITPGSAGGPANVVATGTGTVKVTVSGTPSWSTSATRSSLGH